MKSDGNHCGDDGRSTDKDQRSQRIAELKRQKRGCERGIIGSILIACNLKLVSHYAGMEGVWWVAIWILVALSLLATSAFMVHRDKVMVELLKLLGD